MTMPTFTTATVPTAANLNAVITGIRSLNSLLMGQASPATVYTPAVTAYVNVPHAVATGTDTVITFDAITVNDDNGWVASNSQLTVHTAGIYIASAMAHFDPNATGERFIHILLNGTSVVSNCVAAASQDANNVGEGNAFTAISQPLSLAVGAQVYLSVFQSSGGSLNVDITLSGTALSLLRIGA